MSERRANGTDKMSRVLSIVEYAPSTEMRDPRKNTQGPPLRGMTPTIHKRAFPNPLRGEPFKSPQ